MSKELLLSTLRQLVSDIEADRIDWKYPHPNRGALVYFNIHVHSGAPSHGPNESSDGRMRISCPFAEEDREVTHKLKRELMTAIGDAARASSVRFLSQVLAEAQQVTICDPYFLRPYKDRSVSEYQAAVESVLPKGMKSLELFVKPRQRTKEIAEALETYCTHSNIRLTVYETERIHDRVWIKDHCEAYAVGTSFNGIGSRCAFILQLPPEDLNTFQFELRKVQAESGKLESA